MVSREPDFERWEFLCRRIAGRYFAPGLEHDDLLQEARIGVWKAYRDYDEERGDFGAFVDLCITRNVLTAVKAANRGKHNPLNRSVREFVIDDASGDRVDVTQVLAAPASSAAQWRLELREQLHEIGTAIRERLSELEFACLSGLLAGSTYEEIATRLKVAEGVVDRAITRARWKLRGEGPPSHSRDWGGVRRTLVGGYSCPGCGGPTVKRAGVGRPRLCVVCRVGKAA